MFHEATTFEESRPATRTTDWSPGSLWLFWATATIACAGFWVGSGWLAYRLWLTLF